MIDSAYPIAQLLEEDRRYKLQAYVFLFEALQYAQDELQMGAEAPTEPIPGDEDEPGMHPSLIAQTRLGEPSVVVALIDNSISLDRKVAACWQC